MKRKTFYPKLVNEQTEDVIEKLVESVEGQNSQHIVGSLHMFMMENGDTVVIDSIPKSLLVESNAKQLQKSLKSWVTSHV